MYAHIFRHSNGKLMMRQRDLNHVPLPPCRDSSVRFYLDPKSMGDVCHHLRLRIILPPKPDINGTPQNIMDINFNFLSALIRQPLKG